MMQKIGTLPLDEYESLTIATREARRLSFEALEALNAHTHGTRLLNHTQWKQKRETIAHD
jgi:hypothetical protein